MSDQTETPAQLREAADRGRALARENAFLKAGINPEKDPRLSYFVDGYKGELTTDAILAEAKKAGFLNEPDPEPPAPQAEEPKPEQEGRREASAEEQEFDQMADIGADSAPAGTQQAPDELSIGWEKYAERRQAGDRREDAASEVLGRIMAGAIEGDKRFIV